MKRLFLFALLAVMACGAAVAQKNSVVGKWKIASINVDGMDLDLENPASIKKMLTEQIQKESGQVPDSNTVNMAYSMMAQALEGMRLEFTAGGKGFFEMPNPMGATQKDTCSYTMDYATGIMKTVDTKDGKKEQMTFQFVGDYLVMTKQEAKGPEVVKLKRVKE